MPQNCISDRFSVALESIHGLWKIIESSLAAHLQQYITEPGPTIWSVQIKGYYMTVVLQQGGEDIMSAMQFCSHS